MSVNIKYKNNSIATLTDTGTKTLKTSGKYCEADIIVENTKDAGGGGTEPYAKIITGTHTPAKNETGITFLPDVNFVLRYFILQVATYKNGSLGTNIITRMAVFREANALSKVLYQANSNWSMPNVTGSNQNILVFPGNDTTTLYLGAGVTYNWIAVYTDV